MAHNHNGKNSFMLILSHKRYASPAMVFFIMNVLFGTWALYIPAIKDQLQIDEGAIGLAVFFMALGTLTMLFMAPYLIKKWGVGRATAFGGLAMIFCFAGPFMAQTYVMLCTGLYLVGASTGFTDIAMNTLVTEVEKEDRIHIMSANHGFFSLGGMISAGIGTFFLPYVNEPLNHILVVIGICLVVHLFLVKNYFYIQSDIIEKPGFDLKHFRPLVLLGVIGFLVMASEGAIVDWSALYLEKVSLASKTFIGFGYTAFSFMMALGRFLGDKVSQKYGSRNIVLIGSFLGGLGFLCVLLEFTIFAVFGFGLVGLGLSAIVPELFRLGGKTKGVDSAKGISFVAGSGFAGFLLGPVFLGFLARTSSLKLSFIALFLFTVISFLAGFRIKK
ncbi:MFS transporter [Ascidiimonas aurantiaca]|uniref:MFS transporter n=1 Tax=Ascidiimonas aurantiaca TaxID=1685432 RepID=UPI0030EBBE46